MADLRVDASALSDISARMHSAETALSWDLHALSFDVVGDADVADAAARVRAHSKARAQIVAEMTAAASEYPENVATEFAGLDGQLQRSIR